MERLGGAGGGGAIYEDGEPVVINLSDSESVTVPNGGTWVVNVFSTDNETTNGETIVDDILEQKEIVADEGHTIADQEFGSMIRGWSV